MPSNLRRGRGAGGAQGGGGGSGPATVTKTAPNFFHAPIDVQASAGIPTTQTNVLGITAANIYTNRGAAFEVEDGTNSKHRLKVLKAGNYSLLAELGLITQTSSTVRTVVLARFDIDRGGVVVEGSNGVYAEFTRTHPDAGNLGIRVGTTLDLEVDDLIEFDWWQSGDNSYSGSITALSFVKIVENVGTPTVRGGQGEKGEKGDPGSGVAPGWIEPKDEYDADDLHKFVLENGVEKHIVLEAHAGHARVVEFQTLANAVSALDADGNNVSTGGGGDFLGFFQNVSGIPDASVADEKWAAIIGSGDFEIQDPTSFYSSERWYSYNPFRGSGDRPWATITLADATTLDHVPFTDPDSGNMSDWRIVNTTDHAERFTTAVGEAFFVQQEQKILMVTAYTPHLDGEVEYVAEPYISPSLVRPAGIWYMHGQTVRFPDGGAIGDYTYVPGDGDSSHQRLRWVAGGPQEYWDGGAEFFDDIWIAVADIDSNIDAGVPALATEMVFTLPAGRYNITLFVDAATGGDTTMSVSIRKIQSGVDDVVFGSAQAYNLTADAIGQTANVYVPGLILDGTEQLIGRVGSSERSVARVDLYREDGLMALSATDRFSSILLFFSFSGTPLQVVVDTEG